MSGSLASVDQPPLFDKWIIPKNQDLPDDSNIEGVIAITRDTHHQGVLGKLIFVAQKIHNSVMKLFGWEAADVNLRHGMIILGKDLNPNKPDNYLIAHSVLTGIKVSSWNPKTDPTITETVFWSPREQRLRDAIIKYTRQSAFDSHANEPDYKVQPADFSKKDMIFALFHNHRTTPSRDAMLHTSRAAVQLLVGEQLMNSKGSKPKSFFCTPYVTTLLQGILMMEALDPAERQQLTLGRVTTPTRVDCLARILLDALETRAHTIEGTHPGLMRLSERYWSNPICQLNGRYVYSCYAALKFDQLSARN